MRTGTIVTLAMLAAAGASAQSLVVGNDVSAPNSSDANLATVRTAVELTHPANATGTLDHATFYWSQAGCSAAAKIKVFRRTGDDFTLVAERGPFDITANEMAVTLAPPIPVLQGDLIGVARLAACGNPGAVVPGYDASYIEVAGDATNLTYSAGAVIGSRLAVRATGTATEVVAGVIPAVASNPGRRGSYFRTLVQAFALPGGTPATGRFVFHRKGVPGGPTDPSLSFAIPAGTVQSWADLQDTLGATGAPGSVDIVVPWSARPPMIGAQVYNDQGTDGSTGFREELVPTQSPSAGMGTNIFFAGATGYLFGPADAVAYRSNVAVRSLDAGVEASVQAFHADGTSAGSARSLRYGPNTFDQQSWAEMTGVDLEGGAYLRISVSRGSALFEVSIVDNITNDPADVLARVATAVL